MRNFIILSSLLISLVLLPHRLMARTAEIDSLESLITNYKKEDTSFVNLLNHTASVLQNSYPESALKYINQAGILANDLNYKKGIADNYEQLAGYYFVASEFEKVLDYANKSMQINLAINNKMGLAKNYRTIGNIYYFQGEVEKAISYLENAIELNIELNDSSSLCYNYASIGTDYSDIGNYELAIQYEKAALDIAHKMKDKRAISFALNNLGVVYDLQGNWAEALDCYQQSHLIDERQKNYRDAAISASNIAYILTVKGSYDEALEYCFKGLEYAEKIGFKTGQSYNYEYMGHIYVAQEKYSKAWECQQKTLMLQKQIGNQQGLTNCYKDLADILALQNKFSDAMQYYDSTLSLSKRISYKRAEIGSYIGMAKVYYKQKNYELAHKYSLMALNMAQKLSNVSLISSSAEILANSSEKLGLFKEAYTAHVVFKTMSDSLFNEENIRRIANLEYEFNAEKEKEQLRLAQQKKDLIQAEEIRKHKLIIYAFIGGFLFMVVLAFVILRGLFQKRKANQLLQLKNEEIQSQSVKLKESNESLIKLSLFKEDMTNMLIHDLKNPLSALLNYEIFTDEDDRIGLVNHSACKMMNMVENILDVYKYESTVLELKKEKLEFEMVLNEALEEVNFIAKLNQLNFHISLDSNIYIQSEKQVLRRVLANILSNAIKYSPMGKAISIKAQVTGDGELHVRIHNFGSHIPKEKQEHIFTKYGQIESDIANNYHSTGLGLTYCKMAIDSHGGEIGVDSEKDKGATFWFTIPCA